MATQSSIHFYLNWAKERIDEMDATLASLEGKVSEVQADARTKANQTLADMRKKRDDFRDTVKKQAQANEAAWIREKARLESEWNAFETEAKKYVETFGKQIEQQQATFKRLATAQVKAWREAADNLRTAGKEFAAKHQGEIDASVKQMEVGAAAAEEKLQKLNQAGMQSWSALMGALGETRAAFDRANKAAQEAFKRAAS
jgi:hypothetical protein